MIRHRLTLVMWFKKDRPPLTLSFLEISFAVLVGLVTLLYLRTSLWGQQPYPWNYPSPDAIPTWFTNGRDELFGTFALPITAIMALSAISLLRAIRNDVRGFSRLGHIAMASPLLSLPFAGVLSPITDIVAIILTAATVLWTFGTGKNKGNLVAPILIILWLLIDFQFSSRLWNLISD